MKNSENVISKEDGYFYNRLIDNAIKSGSVETMLNDNGNKIPMNIFEKRVGDIIKGTKLKKAGNVLYLSNSPYYKNILAAIVNLYNKGELDDRYMHEILLDNIGVPEAELVFNKIIANVVNSNKSSKSSKKKYLRDMYSVIRKQKIDFKFTRDNITNIIKAGFRPYDIKNVKNVDWDDAEFIINFIEASVSNGYDVENVGETVKEVCVTYDKDNREVIYKVCEKSDIVLKAFMKHLVFPLSFTDKHFSRMLEASMYKLVDIQIFPESRYRELFENEKFLNNYFDIFTERFRVPEGILDKYFQKICGYKYSEYHWEHDSDDDYYEDEDRKKTEYDDDRIENDEVDVSGGIYALINQRLSAEFIRKNFKYFVKHNLLKALIKTQSIPFDCISENINTFVKAGHTNLLLEKQKCYEILSKIKPIEEYLERKNNRDDNDD